MTSVTDVSATAKASFALQPAHVLHELWPVVLQVLGRERLPAEERLGAKVPDRHQDDADQDRRRADHEHRRRPAELPITLTSATTAKTASATDDTESRLLYEFEAVSGRRVRRG